MRHNAIRAAAAAAGGWCAAAQPAPLLLAVVGAGMLVAVLALVSALSRRRYRREAAYATLALVLGGRDSRPPAVPGNLAAPSGVLSPTRTWGSPRRSRCGATGQGEPRWFAGRCGNGPGGSRSGWRWSPGP